MAQVRYSDIIFLLKKVYLMILYILYWYLKNPIYLSHQLTLATLVMPSLQYMRVHIILIN